jgi:hypothetical protein
MRIAGLLLAVDAVAISLMGYPKTFHPNSDEAPEGQAENGKSRRANGPTALSTNRTRTVGDPEGRRRWRRLLG